MLLGRLWTSLYSSCGSLAHLPVDLCSHWSVGLSGGEGTAVYIWDVGGVNLKLGSLHVTRSLLVPDGAASGKRKVDRWPGLGRCFPISWAGFWAGQKFESWTWPFLRHYQGAFVSWGRRIKPVLLNSWLVWSVTFSILTCDLWATISTLLPWVFRCRGWICTNHMPLLRC